MNKIDQSPQIIAVTPSDVTVYDPPLVGLRVGTTAGDITVRSGGIDVVIDNVNAGETVWCKVNMVYSTGTAAVGINGFQWKELS